MREALSHSVAPAEQSVLQIAGLAPSEVVTRMGHGERFVFVDARPPGEWDTADAKLPGAIHVPADEILQHLKEIPLGHPVVSYCTSPRQEASARVAEKLMLHGFLNAQPLIGGFEAWLEAGYPVEPK